MTMESSDSSHFHVCNSSGNSVLPVPGFSAYSFLRNYNYFLSSQAPEPKSLHSSLLSPTVPPHPPAITADVESLPCPEKPFLNFLPTKPLLPSSLFGYQHNFQLSSSDEINNRSNKTLPPYHFPYSSCYKRQRGEKKPIPDEQKDEKYFERRRRNNHAAKKSRDARKMREDQIAFRATLLEHENALLRAQLLTMREEAASLRQMLLQKKALELANRESQICGT